MRLNEPIELKGYFWLPGKERERIPGTLRISDGGNITLEILGHFGKSIENFAAVLNSSPENELDISRIIGVLEKERLVTLDECFYTRRKHSFHGVAKSEIVANWAIVGVAYDEGEEVLIDSFSFSVEGIDEWLQVNNLTTSFDDDGKNVLVKYTQKDDVELCSNDEFCICIKFGCGLKHDRTSSIRIEKDSSINISWKNPVSPSTCVALAHKLVSFICLALDDIVCIMSVKASSSSLHSRPNGAASDPMSMLLYYSAINYVEKRQGVKKRHALFSFQDIKDESKSVVSAWLAAYDLIEPALGLYFFSRMSMQKYSESRFLALSQAIETYHRRTTDETLMAPDKFQEALDEIKKSIAPENWDWVSQKLKYGNELSLNKRILSMLTEFNSFFGTKKDIKKLCRVIVDSRNYFTHYDNELSDKVARGENLWALCLKMEILLQLHLLARLAFSREKIEVIVRSSNRIDQALKLKVVLDAT